MFPIIAAIFAFIIGGIICPIRVNINAKLRGTFCKADVKLRIFYALVPLKISFKLNFTPFGGFYAVLHGQEHRSPAADNIAPCIHAGQGGFSFVIQHQNAALGRF